MSESLNRAAHEAICDIANCGKPRLAKGLCPMHYRRLRLTGTTEPKMRTRPTCKIDGCTRLARSAGWCNTHYERWRRRGKQGDPTTSNQGKADTRPDDVRFWERVAITANDDLCWEWQGYRDKKGYGRFGAMGRDFMAPQFSFYLARGRLSDLHILHSCDNPPCVNPKHLREGTHQENMADMVAKGRGAWQKRNN